jgi:hypothetical protein
LSVGAQRVMLAERDRRIVVLQTIQR